MAFGSDQDVKIQVTTNVEGAITGLKNVDKSLEEVGKQAQSASGILDKFSTGIIQGIGQGAAQAAIQGLVSALGSIPAAIQRGAQVDDIVSSFDKLSKSAGVSGDALINKFGHALGDTIPKVDLMKQANELLVGGLDPKQFDLVAKAARALGETTGTDAKQGLEKLSDSLLRGNDRALKNLGIIVDNNKAYADFAKSIGTTADKLSEEGKVMATREAVLKALAENQAKLGEVTDDAADKLDQMSAALQNQKDQALQALSNNKELNLALGELAKIIQSIDFTPLINGITSTISFFVKATNEVVPRFIDGLDRIQRTISVLGIALSTGAPLSLAVDVQAFKESQAAIQKQTDAAKNLAVSLHNLKNTNTDLSDSNNKTGKSVRDLTGLIDKSKLAEDADKKSKVDKQKTLEQLKKNFEEITKAHQQYIDSIQKAVSSDERFKTVSDQLARGQITQKEAQEKLTQIIKDNKDTTDLAANAQDRLKDAVGAVTNNTPQAQKAIEDYTASLQALADKQNSISSSSGSGGGFFDNLLKGLGLTDSGANFNLGESIGATLASGISQGISAALSGGLSKQQTGQLGGSILGSIAGAIIGGLPGAVIGQNIGAIIGQIVASAFDHETAGTKGRKAADKYFADIFDANRLSVIVGGQLKQINDLVFSGTTLFGGDVNFGDSSFNKYLLSLPQDAQAAFNGVGDAFAELLGLTDDISGQIGAAIANNIGGSLNNLQLFIEATGKSAEELTKALFNVFLNGKITAGEYLSEVNKINQTMTKGIPDGIGQVQQAFDNLKAAGEHGGRALVDALGDIGVEAKELGLKTLPQLQDYLIKTGKYTKDEVQKLMDALAAGGIKSVDALANANQQQLLPTLAKLSELKFPFAEASDDAKKFADDLSKIPDKKDVTVNIKANISKEDRDIINKTANLQGGPGLPAK